MKWSPKGKIIYVTCFVLIQFFQCFSMRFMTIEDTPRELTASPQLTAVLAQCTPNELSICRLQKAEPHNSFNIFNYFASSESCPATSTLPVAQGLVRFFAQRILNEKEQNALGEDPFPAASQSFMEEVADSVIARFPLIGTKKIVAHVQGNGVYNHQGTGSIATRVHPYRWILKHKDNAVEYSVLVERPKLCNASWSPDGTVGIMWNPEYMLLMKKNVYRLEKRRTIGSREHINFLKGRWSPDSSMFAMNGAYNECSGIEICHVDALFQEGWHSVPASELSEEVKLEGNMQTMNYNTASFIPQINNYFIWTPDSKHIAAIRDDCDIYIYQSDTQVCVRNVTMTNVHPWPLIAVNNELDACVEGREQKKLHLYRREHSNRPLVIDAELDSLHSLCSMPDKNSWAVIGMVWNNGLKEYVIKIYDAETGSLRQTLPFQQFDVRDTVDQKTLVKFDWPVSALTWDATTQSFYISAGAHKSEWTYKYTLPLEFVKKGLLYLYNKIKEERATEKDPALLKKKIQENGINI